jgi:UDP-N-acetylglucosamine--N-acetylmuramyl-(pentapeptide) pyrophosphoryl-undecaprenol N-acetylglucosamine transferase
MKKSNVNIVICGGHFSPAIALIDYLTKKRSYNIFFIGRRYSMEGDKSYSIEYQAISKLNIPFYALTTGRLPRFLSIKSVLSLLKVPFGFLQSIYLLLKIRPQIVVSFGGYIGLPVCFSAKLFGIKIITHEQTHVLGLTNRLISKVADKVCLSFKETKYAGKVTNTVITGNPVRPEIINPKLTALIHFGDTGKKLIYITGGSTGARSINSVVKNSLTELLKEYRVIHQCGSAGNNADFKDLMEFKNSLLPERERNYKVFAHIIPSEIGGVYKNSDLVISRSGANSIQEIALYRKPSILIPLPWSADNEQLVNAKILEKGGMAIIISQNELTKSVLLTKITHVFKNYSSFLNAAKRADGEIFDINGSAKLTGIIDGLINS